MQCRFHTFISLLLLVCLLPATVLCAPYYAVDFDYLSVAAPDGVAWLYQPDSPINNPILYHADASRYLKRKFNGDRNHNGSLFVTGERKPSFHSTVVTIFGRNATDDSLFGSLPNYKDPAYYAAHPSLYLLTPQANYRLDVFAAVSVPQRDKDSWCVAPMSPKALYEQMLPGVLERSFLTPDPALLPTEKDGWALLSTDSPTRDGTRYVLYARKRPLVQDDTQAPQYLNQLEMDERETQNGYTTFEGVGTWMIYAQNDPMWKKLIFEANTSNLHRSIGDGGCGPTAVAMMLANLVPKEELPKLSEVAASDMGFCFCSCSVNEYHCHEDHLPYQLTEPDEYLRYLPMAIASYATGNNRFGVQGRFDRFGSSMAYLDSLCEVFSITLTKERELSNVLEYLKQPNTLAIASTSGASSPFTNSSHFLVLADVDDEYLYILDPFRRESYKKVDRYGYLEYLAPGLVRTRLEDAEKCGLFSFYQFYRER